jgi:NADH-quinone oxidoreductase subunit E
MTQNPLTEDPISLEKLISAIRSFGRERKNLIPILQFIQQDLSYIPPEAIQMVGEHMGIAACEIYGVATFYNQFRFSPPGKHPIKVCLGTACHVKGGEIILENFARKLGIQDGETTADREFSIERVACVGCCALAPVALLGETVHGHMAPSKVEGMILGFQIEKEKQGREKGRDES